MVRCPRCKLTIDHVLRKASSGANTQAIAVERLKVFAVRWGFSPREQQISWQLIEGKNNAQIADALRLHEGSVKNYLRLMYEKAGASDRLELVSMIWLGEMETASE